MDPSRFDSLTRLLSDAPSRRTLLGSVLAVLTGVLTVPEGDAKRKRHRTKNEHKQRGAQKGKKRNVKAAKNQKGCSRFCTQLPPGRQRGQCRSDCAQGRGLFVQCGEDPNRLCQQPSGAFVCCDPGVSCVGGACQPQPPPGCTADGDCDDGNPCTTDTCTAGTCSNVAIPGCVPCSFDEECDDGNPCTADTCSGGACTSVAIPGCAPCTFDEECDDGDPCTFDYCNTGGGGGDGEPSLSQIGGTCSHVPECQSFDACEVCTCTPGAAELCTCGPKCPVGQACHFGRCYIPGICTPEQEFVCGLDNDQYQAGVCGPDPDVLCHCYTRATGGNACVLEEFCPEVQPCDAELQCPTGRVCVMSCCGPQVGGGDRCCDDGNLYPRCFRECPPHQDNQ